MAHEGPTPAGGVIIFGNAQPDFGKGARGSIGFNTIMNNTEWDMVNMTTHDIYAKGNQWTHWYAGDMDIEAVDEDDIYDRIGQDPTLGEVLWWECPMD